MSSLWRHSKGWAGASYFIAQRGAAGLGWVGLAKLGEYCRLRCDRDRAKPGVIARPDDWVSRRSSDLARSCAACCPLPDNAQRSACYDSSGLDLWQLQRQCLDDGGGGDGSSGSGSGGGDGLPLYPAADYAISLSRPRCRMRDGARSQSSKETTSSRHGGKRRVECKSRSKRKSAEQARFMDNGGRRAVGVVVDGWV